MYTPQVEWFHMPFALQHEVTSLANLVLKAST